MCWVRNKSTIWVCSIWSVISTEILFFILLFVTSSFPDCQFLSQIVGSLSTEDSVLENMSGQCGVVLSVNTCFFEREERERKRQIFWHSQLEWEIWIHCSNFGRCESAKMFAKLYIHHLFAKVFSVKFLWATVTMVNQENDGNLPSAFLPNYIKHCIYFHGPYWKCCFMANISILIFQIR